MKTLQVKTYFFLKVLALNAYELNSPYQSCPRFVYVHQKLNPVFDYKYSLEFVCVCVLLIHKGYFVEEKNILNASNKAFFFLIYTYPSN